MSEGPDLPNSPENASPTAMMAEAKRAHMAKLEAAADAVKKDYGKSLEIDGTSVSAMYDAITVLRHRSTLHCRVHQKYDVAVYGDECAGIWCCERL